MPNIEYYEDPYEAVLHTDALLILTDWPEYKKLDFDKINQKMTSPKIVDGKNILDSVKMKDIGFEYRGIGRD